MVVEAAEGWLATSHDYNREQAIRDVTALLPSEVGCESNLGQVDAWTSPALEGVAEVR